MFLQDLSKERSGVVMMRRALWLIPVLLLCGSCTTTFTHESKGPDDFERDRAACERISKQKLAKKGIT